MPTLVLHDDSSATHVQCGVASQEQAEQMAQRFCLRKGLDYSDYQVSLLPTECTRNQFDLLFAVTSGMVGQRQKSLTELQTEKRNEIRAACTVAIEAGFDSSALGDPHHYPSKRGEDQVNLVGAVATGGDIGFPCRDSAGKWQRKLHTAAQIAQVLADGATLKQQYLERYDVKTAEIDAAADETEINLISWD